MTVELEIPTDQIIPLTISGDQVEFHEEVIKEIISYLNNEEMNKVSVKLNQRILNNWSWKTNEGKLSKRIQKAIYEKYKYKLDDKTLSRIGDIARNYIPKEQTYYFDITKNLEWKAGNFGDHQSCFFNQHGDEHAVRKAPNEMLAALSIAPNYYALRWFTKIPKNRILVSKELSVFYTDETSNYLGLSRSWIYFGYLLKKPTRFLNHKDLESHIHNSPDIDINKEFDKTIILFNGYGYNTKLQSDLLASYLGGKYESYQASELNGFGYYINGNNRIISPVPIIDSGRSYYLPVVNPNYNENAIISRDEIRNRHAEIIENVDESMKSTDKTTSAYQGALTRAFLSTAAPSEAFKKRMDGEVFRVMAQRDFDAIPSNLMAEVMGLYVN
jgi:hypothetical protein